MAKSKNHLDISILIATYNRAEILRKTLESMTCLERDGLSVEFVVVDNNSSDHTKEVIESFSDRLPIRYLFEPRPGKNCALNKALREVPLGKLVAFTDDDVVPQEDWLKTIVAACKRWPNYRIFGGRTYLIWPNTAIPSWAQCSSVHGWGLGLNDAAMESEQPYPSTAHPSGANFWIRQELLGNGRHYDESIGPHPGKNFAMGSETSFLKQLTADGYSTMHIPNSVVGHRVPVELLSKHAIKKRAYRYGRGFPYLKGLPRKELMDKHYILWRLIRIGAIAKLIIKYGLTMLYSTADERVIKSTKDIRWIAYNVESLRIASRIRKEQLLHRNRKS